MEEVSINLFITLLTSSYSDTEIYKFFLEDRKDEKADGNSCPSMAFALSINRSDFSSHIQQKKLKPILRSKRDRIAKGTPFVTSLLWTNA